MNNEVLELIEEAKRDNETVLDLSDKGLTSIPKLVFELTGLQTLYL